MLPNKTVALRARRIVFTTGTQQQPRTLVINRINPQTSSMPERRGAVCGSPVAPIGTPAQHSTANAIFLSRP